MTNDQIIWKAEKLACVLPMYCRSDFANVVLVAIEESRDVQRQRLIIDEQQEQIALLRDRVKQLNGVLFLLSVLVEKVTP